MVAQRTVSVIPMGNVQKQTEQATVWGYSPKYTIPATVEMTSLSIPLLFKSSKFSKYVDAIDALMFPPDCVPKLVIELMPL